MGVSLFFLMLVLLNVKYFVTLFISILAQNVVVFPSRAVAIENALRLFSPRLAIVDEHLTRHLPRQWLTSLVIEVC
jgi:di/tricarboxylate transporter